MGHRGLRRTLLGTLLLWLLAGCGSGDSNSFNSYFGTGTVPGGSFGQQTPARIMGAIVQRTSDQRVLIVANPTAAGVPVTAVSGATVALVEAQLSSVTGSTGTYDFQSLTPGTYTLRITLPAALGGATADFKVTVDPGQTLEGLPAAANL